MLPGFATALCCTWHRINQRAGTLDGTSDIFIDAKAKYISPRQKSNPNAQNQHTDICPCPPCTASHWQIAIHFQMELYSSSLLFRPPFHPLLRHLNQSNSNSSLRSNTPSKEETKTQGRRDSTVFPQLSWDTRQNLNDLHLISCEEIAENPWLITTMFWNQYKLERGLLVPQFLTYKLN